MIKGLDSRIRTRRGYTSGPLKMFGGKECALSEAFDTDQPWGYFGVVEARDRRSNVERPGVLGFR